MQARKRVLKAVASAPDTFSFEEGRKALVSDLRRYIKNHGCIENLHKRTGVGRMVIWNLVNRPATYRRTMIFLDRLAKAIKL